MAGSVFKHKGFHRDSDGFRNARGECRPLYPAAFAPLFEGPVFDDKVPTGSYFHYLHHRYFHCNFGESTLPLDKWFGSYDSGVPETDESEEEALPASGVEPPEEPCPP